MFISVCISLAEAGPFVVAYKASEQSVYDRVRRIMGYEAQKQIPVILKALEQIDCAVGNGCILK